ncbi:exodeoxyribonuclease VII large subunit [Spirochaeta cellobiosiphila]|uniref:exodeoxyribonuclease VII large subunit n=1 Tax=Spirochaeta cellobiosiphila TaxID=504483 RepID=UPI000429A304|nr:exodeoxyribonuclease VII large subunit [Spirochaeta cellobiosiphila]
MFSSTKALQVSELTQIIQKLLEENLNDICLEGEISNYRPASSGHVYFTLKDNHSVISAVMFRSSASALRFRPKDGDFVKVTGRLSVYPPRGSYQIVCDTMDLAGEGQLLAILEQRKQRFAQLGYFDANKKKQIPSYPERIAIITSPTGAAIRDIQRVIKSRYDNVHLIVVPSLVQGNEAGDALAKRVRQINRLGLADVIILTRGGGSLEDLICFSEEILVQAVVDSRIPIISAVGHEIDWALTDFAADYRAATPSAAAEKVTENWLNFYDRLYSASQDMRYFVQNQIDQVRKMTGIFSKQDIQRSFQIYLQPFQQRLDEAKEQLMRHIKQNLDDKCNWLNIRLAQLEEFNPQKIIRRGYSLIKDEEGNIVSTSKIVNPQDRLTIHLQDGHIETVVQGVTNEEQ